MTKSSQAALEFILAFAAVIILVLGLTRVWVWFGANFAKRQVDYQSGRLQAATPLSADAAGTAELVIPDNRLELTPAWVFSGVASGTVGKVQPYGSLINPAGSPTVVNADTGCAQSVADLRTQAASLRDIADDMEEECDSTWEQITKPLCWFYGDELADGADNLRDGAAQIEAQATALEAECG